jgi:glycosidase
MQGKKPDEDIRLPMQWSANANAGFTTGTPWRAPAADYPQVNVAAQDKDQDSLLNHYRVLTKLRQEHPALSSQTINLIETSNSGLYAALRTSESEKILVLVNLTDKPISDYHLSLDVSALPDGVLIPKSLMGTEAATPITVSGGKFSGYKPIDKLSPYQSYMFQLK